MFPQYNKKKKKEKESPLFPLKKPSPLSIGGRKK